MKTNIQTRRGFTLVELLVVIVIIASLAGLTAPMVIRQRKKADQTEAVNNIRQIGFAMLEFDSDYGSYPGTTSLAQLDTGPVVGSVGGNSNGYFQMFFQAGLTSSEAMFFCKAKRTSKPDGVIATQTDCLKAGEVGFGYCVDTGNEGYNSAGNPARPLIMAPLSLGATSATFDPDPFDKNAVLLRGDNSVSSLKINATSFFVSQGGVNPFDAGATSIWASATPPTIAIPTPLP